ncbi:MAG: PAS domain S-box protein [Methylobacter sp.]|nr:PAS domain S-box protein [Methylobacter sp.]
MFNECSKVNDLLPAWADISARKQAEEVLKVYPEPLVELVNKCHCELKKSKESLEQSQHNLKLAIASGQVGIWNFNLQTNELIWDDAMFALYGACRKDFSGAYDAWSTRLHPDDRAVTETALNNAISGKSNYSPDFRVIWANGEVHHLKGHAHVITNKAGTPQYMVGTNWDNSAFADTHEQLLLAHTAINNSKSSFIWLTSDGRLADTNDFACISLGYSQNELRDLNVWDFDVEMSTESWSDIWTQLKKSGKYQGERLYRRKNGTNFPVDVSSDLIVINGKEYSFSFVIDTTERKQIEQRLSEANDFNISILNSLTAHISVLDSQGVIVATNSAWQQFSLENGLSEIETNFIGLSYLDVCNSYNQNYEYDLDAIAARKGILAVIKGELKVFVMDYPCHSPSQQHWFHLKVTQLDNSSNYIVISHENITERKQKEQIDQEHLDQLAHVTRLGLMGEMASGLAHEVNQPLAAIANYAQASLNLMKKGNPDLIKLAEVAIKTKEQALRAGQIIHRMKEFCKSRSQQRSTIDINALINESVSLCTDQLKQNNITIILKLDDKLSHIYVDNIQIEQVLINLIRNSMDAIVSMPENKKGEITIQSYSTSNHEIQVSVQDNGSGIEEDQQSKILLPFHTKAAIFILRCLFNGYKCRLIVQAEPQQ